jgi:curved DNA-binding protein CbpA
MQSVFDDYYELLGVDSAITATELRRAWRRLALRWHPDRAGPEATATFQKLAAAYAVLSDPVARAAYDRAHRAVEVTGEGRSVQATRSRATPSRRVPAGAVSSRRPRRPCRRSRGANDRLPGYPRQGRGAYGRRLRTKSGRPAGEPIHAPQHDSLTRRVLDSVRELGASHPIPVAQVRRIATMNSRGKENRRLPSMRLGYAASTASAYARKYAARSQSSVSASR